MTHHAEAYPECSRQGRIQRGYRFNERAKDKAQNWIKRVGRRMMMFESIIGKEGTRGARENAKKKFFEVGAKKSARGTG
jgi:hypothetical protein